MLIFNKEIKDIKFWFKIKPHGYGICCHDLENYGPNSSLLKLTHIVNLMFMKLNQLCKVVCKSNFKHLSKDFKQNIKTISCNTNNAFIRNYWITKQWIRYVLSFARFFKIDIQKYVPIYNCHNSGQTKIVVGW